MGDGRALNKAAVSERHWYAVPAKEAVSALSSDANRGLDGAEVERRRETFGENKLPERGRETLVETVLRQFKDPLIYILLAAGAVSLAIEHFEDAGFIFAVLLFNAGSGGLGPRASGFSTA